MAAKRKSFVARRKNGPTGTTRTIADRSNSELDFPSRVAQIGERCGIGRSTAICLALGLLTVAVYAQVWRFDFVTIDDPQYVFTNPHVQYGLSASGIKWAFEKFYFANWAPLTWLTYMLEASTLQTWPGGYHITNVFLHIANVLLVFRVIRQATGWQLQSAFVAGLFAVHPIHAESVAWISGLKDVLSIFFGLLCLSAWLSYVHQRRMRWYGLSLLLFIASLMSKQTLVTLPCVMLLLDFWPLRRLSLRVVLEKIPYFAISAVFAAIVFLAQANGTTVRSLDSLPIAVRLATVAVSYASYLQKAIVPWNLGVYYPYVDVSLSQIAASIAVVVLMTAAAYWARRRYPFFTVGWLWFLGTLIPMIGVVQVGSQQMADRYAYFSFIGLYLACAGFVTSRRAAIALVGVAAVVGYVQVGYWHDTLTLAEHTLQVTEDNTFMRYAMGDALVAEARVDEAMEQYRKPVVLEPWNASTHCKLGEAYQRFNHVDEARQAYRIALALDDNIAAAHSGLGWIAMQAKQSAIAKREFDRALDLDPGDQTNYFNLALLSRMNNDLEGSIGYCRGALSINEYMIASHHLIAENLRLLGRKDEADAQLRYALSIAPYDDQAREMLAR
jgi:tetratricopeptide (TPR) repeat protein